MLFPDMPIKHRFLKTCEFSSLQCPARWPKHPHLCQMIVALKVHYKKPVVPTYPVKVSSEFAKSIFGASDLAKCFNMKPLRKINPRFAKVLFIREEWFCAEGGISISNHMHPSTTICQSTSQRSWNIWSLFPLRKYENVGGFSDSLGRVLCSCRLFA